MMDMKSFANRLCHSKLILPFKNSLRAVPLTSKTMLTNLSFSLPPILNFSLTCFWNSIIPPHASIKFLLFCINTCINLSLSNSLSTLVKIILGFPLFKVVPFNSFDASTAVFNFSASFLLLHSTIMPVFSFFKLAIEIFILEGSILDFKIFSIWFVLSVFFPVILMPKVGCGLLDNTFA
ncbi:hypothetical protein ILUMI_16010 [Ignelater luminosus]|uniref:Uncharacterized protein n=1 Tax=Ignelater luminosus TaxID=2038154 RepID=A0A8K0CT24_IGNLU|nr:hypothetical protein ILUMI_16010 [Ignelater luminosus]